MIDRPKFKEYKEISSVPEKLYDIVEPKMDGIWGVYIQNEEGWEIWSRTGVKKAEGTDCSSIGAPRDKIILLGEFMFGSNWAYERDLDREFFAFDILRYGDEELYDKPLTVRREILEEVLRWNMLPPFVRIIDQYPITEIDKVWDELVEKKNYEGLVLKRNDGIYGDKWGRIKHRTSIDYVCMGIEEGRGRLEGMVGGILGGLFNDDKECVIVCKVGGGLKDDERKDLWENREQLIGSVFTAGGYKVYKSGAIRHPQFMGFRDDKQTGECTFEQIPS
tara:strand:- start:59 stop:889 length:831 start_codon:yes stop_codon:yes gene_type:complete